MSDSDERAQLSDLVDQLENEGMALDGGGDASGVHLLFRTVHNLKSLTVYMGLKDAAARFHHLEDGLDAIRRGREPWTAAWSDQVFHSIDLARGALGQTPQPAAKPEPKAAVPAGRGASTWGLALTPEEADRTSDAILQGLGIYRIEKLFKLGLSREDFQTLPVMEDVAEVGTLLAIQPSWDVYAAGPCQNSSGGNYPGYWKNGGWVSLVQPSGTSGGQINSREIGEFGHREFPVQTIHRPPSISRLWPVM